MVSLHETRGDDPDHPVMPVALRQQQKRWDLALGIRFHQGGGFGFDRIAEIPSLAVEIVTTASQGHRLNGIGFGEKLHHQNGITESSDRIDPRGQLKTDVLGAQGRFAETRQPLQCHQAFTTAAVQSRQSLQQPTPVGSGQRCHVGNCADTEQITRHLNRVHAVQPFGDAAGQHVGQSHTGKTPIGRSFRRGGGMQ